MGVCTVVAELATALADQRSDVSAAESLFLQVIRLMPVYAEAQKLNLWEEHLGDVTPFEDQPLNQVQAALEAIADLGGCNLYTLLDEQRTAQHLSQALEKLHALDVDVPDIPAITDW